MLPHWHRSRIARNMASFPNAGMTWICTPLDQPRHCTWVWSRNYANQYSLVCVCSLPRHSLFACGEHSVIKNFLRSAVGEDRLNHLVTFSTENALAKQINCNAIDEPAFTKRYVAGLTIFCTKESFGFSSTNPAASWWGLNFHLLFPTGVLLPGRHCVLLFLMLGQYATTLPKACPFTELDACSFCMPVPTWMSCQYMPVYVPLTFPFKRGWRVSATANSHLMLPLISVLLCSFWVHHNSYWWRC